MFDTIVAVTGVVGVFVAVLAWQYPKRHPRSNANETAENPTVKRTPQSGAARQANGGTDQTHTVPYVPDGIVFGDKAVLVPGFQQLLCTHSGWVESTILRGKQYSWLKRGDVIGRYHMNVPNSDADYFRHIMGSKHLNVDVRSPVSGLIIHSKFGYFVTWPAPDQAESNLPGPSLSVLIADDEPPPESNSYMFGPALEFINAHKGPFFRSSRYWSLGPMTDERFSKLVQAQKDAQCLIVDAMPTFKDYFEEARTRYPSLRQHLRHLL